MFGAADVLLVPLIPSPLSVRTYEQLLEFLAAEVAKPPRVLAFFSMVDGRKRLHNDVIAELAARPTACSRARSPRPPTSSGWRCSAACSRSSRPAAARRAAYEALWAELHGRL